MANIPRFLFVLYKCIIKKRLFQSKIKVAKSLYLQGFSAILLTEERKSA